MSAKTYDINIDLNPGAYSPEVITANAALKNAVPTPTGVLGSIPTNPTTPTTTPRSSTVLSNANVIENTIPNNTKKLDGLAAKGTQLGPDGLERYSDGTLVTRTIKSPQGNDYTLDNNGQIIAGPAGGDYRVGDNIEKYQGANNPAFATADDYYNQQIGFLDSMKANLDAQTKASIDNIQQKYAVRRTQLEDINRRQEASKRETLILGGSDRYAQISSDAIISDQERYGIMQLAELDAEENDLINQAKNAQTDGDFKLMADRLALAENKRKEKQSVSDNLNKIATEENKKIQEKATQSAKDVAIANVYGSGTTNPKDILLALNKDGGNYTADEISKTLAIIAKNNGFENLDKLSSNVQDFYVLKQNSVLPPEITALPEGEQLKAWINYVKPAKAPGVKSVNKITLAEATSKGLPMSVVGRAEQDIVDDLTMKNPPTWFIEKAQSEKGSVISPQNVQNLWDEYRRGFGQKKTTPTTSTYDKGAETNKAKASNYFKNNFEGVDEEGLSALTDAVQYYMDGGMTYAKAIEKVESEALE